MIHPSIEQMAERFVHEVHDTARLRGNAHHHSRSPGEEIAPLEEKQLDLPNDFWFKWLETYAQVRVRPKTTQHLVHRDDIPPPLRDAVVRDFAERALDRLFREIDTQRPTLAYHVMRGQDRQATYREDGTRV